MPLIAAKLEAMGLVLPKAVRLPPGVVLPFRLVRVLGRRAYVSGHGPLNPDGSLAPPLGKVGRDLSVEQGYRAARLTALANLGSLERELGDLDRVAPGREFSGWSTRRPASIANRPSSTGFPTSSSNCSGPIAARMPAAPSAWPNFRSTSRRDRSRTRDRTVISPAAHRAQPRVSRSRFVEPAASRPPVRGYHRS